MEAQEWSLPAVYEVVAAAVPDRDMLVWKHDAADLRGGRGANAQPRRVPRSATASASAASATSSSAGSAARRPVAAAPLQLPRVHRVDARLLPRPRRAVQRQPALPARGDPQPARHGRRRGRRLPPRARPARRRGGARTRGLLLVDVDDGSGVAAARRQHELRGRRRASPPTRRASRCPSPDDLYLVCTGGTTGSPKAVLWRQGDIFVAAMGGSDDASRESADGARRRPAAAPGSRRRR